MPQVCDIVGMAATTIIRTAAQQVIEARLGEDIDEAIRRRYAAGMTQAEIATDIGASRASVVRWMRRLSLETRRPGERAA